MEFDEFKKTLVGLQNFDLERIDTKEDFDSVTFRFSFGAAPGSETTLSLLGVLLFSFSKTPSTGDRWYYIGEVTAERIDPSDDIFGKLRYGFVDSKAGIVSFPGIELYHCHIEGSIVVDIVCQSFVINGESVR